MDNNTKPAPSAPWHLWLIGVLLLLWHGLGVFDYVATIIRYEPYLSGFPEDVLAYYYAAPLWMFAMWAIAVFGGLISAILLLMRNKLAVPLFAVSLASSVVSLMYAIVNPAPQGASNNLFAAIIISIAAVVLVYVIWLKRRGVLR